MSDITQDEQTDEEFAEVDVRRAVARIQTGVLTVVFGLIAGVGLFVMTAWLLIRNGPNVGAHLQLLANYFPGYSVTWVGSFVGLFYGLLVGGATGWAIGTIYNRIVLIRHRS